MKNPFCVAGFAHFGELSTGELLRLQHSSATILLKQPKFPILTINYPATRIILVLLEGSRTCWVGKSQALWKIGENRALQAKKEELDEENILWLS